MTASTPPTLPPGRYGPEPSRARRTLLIAAAAVAVVAGLAWALWAGISQGSADVRWSDVGFEIHGTTSVDVTYDVTKDPDATAVCSLRALDRHKTAVGIAQVRIGPASQRVTRRTDTVQTSAQAVTGIVYSCSLAS